MSANAYNRETGRDALAVLLTTALVGAGKPAQAVYGYQPTDFGNLAPVVLVLSSGTVSRTPNGIGAKKYISVFRYEILTFTPEADTAETWTRQDMEDTMDLLEKSIADVIMDNQSTANWTYIWLEDAPTRILPAQVGGEKYRMEIIPVLMKVQDA